MKFSEAWLREWTDPPLDTAALVERLTMAGLEVDSVEPAASDFSGVVVGRVLSVAPHPDADRLRLCRVDVGAEAPLDIVCGAPNVAEGMHVPTALVGASLPGGMRIRKAKLRGAPSFGMLCSARELGLAEEASGLMALPADAAPGTDLRELLGLDDQVIDIDITPNRGDCLSLAGIAREVATLTDSPLRVPDMVPVAPVLDDRFPVRVTAPAACPRYLGRVVRGVDPAAPTPLWMQERLRRGGLRSLGPLVDVTNYVMLELGQPMHAFDLARLEGGIEVRMARAEEGLVLLDGRAVTLADDTLVIADRRRVLALAGIMGGEASGVGPETRDLFLECAFFSPLAVSGRARRYGLQTDSSYRFERGVDPALQARAMERATALLLEIAGARPGPVVEVASAEHLPQTAPIGLRRARLDQQLGLAIPDAEVERSLGGLGMQVERVADGWRVRPPSFRFDIAIEADLVEEVARIHGYDRLPRRLPQGGVEMPPRPDARLDRDRLRAALVDRGYHEIITYTFIDPEWQRALDPDQAPLALANPLSAEMSVMRTSLWPGLLQTLAYNRNRQQERVRIFETGLIFIPQDDEIVQEEYIGGALCGPRWRPHWDAGDRPLDFFDAKGDLEALLALTGRGADFDFEAASHPALHPGQSARVLDGGTPLGWLGRIHPALARQRGLPEETCLFQLQLEPLLRGADIRFAPVPAFPSVRRDLALVMDADRPVAELLRGVREAAGEWLQDLILFDVYQGKGIESGKKSVALGLILQDPSRTLRDEDVEAVIGRVLDSLARALNATLRE